MTADLRHIARAILFDTVEFGVAYVDHAGVKGRLLKRAGGFEWESAGKITRWTDDEAEGVLVAALSLGDAP